MLRHIRSKLLVTIGCSLFLFVANVVAQGIAKKTINSLTIVDITGNPIQGATVYGTFGVSSTDYAGKCYIKFDGSGTVFVEKTGFKPLIVLLSNLKDKLTLEKAEFLSSEGDVLNMGFIQQKKRDVVTSVASLKPDDRITYDNTESALNHVDGMLTGLRAGSDIRGLGNAMYVIDGIPGREISLVDASEIEQINST